MFLATEVEPRTGRRASEDQGGFKLVKSIDFAMVVGGFRRGGGERENISNGWLSPRRGM